MRRKKLLLVILMGMLCVGACAKGNVPAGNMGTVSQAPIATEAPDVTETPEPTVTPEPTSTPEPTATPEPTPLPEDTTAPELVLLGENSIKVVARREFTDPGFVATDDRDGDLTASVQVEGEVDVNWCGSYTLTYTVADAAGNTVTAERVVEVAQPETVYPEGKVIYLTFDDGPGKYTEDILGLLDKYGIKATFFVCGTRNTALYKKIHEAGHSIGAHCLTHDYDVVYENDEAYFADLNAILDLIYENTGVRTTMIRFPGGSSNKVSMICPGIMTRITEKVTNMGFQYYDWNVSAEDSVTKVTEEILNSMIVDTPKYKYPIVLQHPENRKFSFDAVEDFIVWGLENGYTFLSLTPESPTVHHRIKN
ncbi:MAG: polysaccharide deacetylase family protein [Lachnospiraceae bacterium]|nr:polysaccharide deacetylase family protein [Lachnospiraceae bacterium]